MNANAKLRAEDGRAFVPSNEAQAKHQEIPLEKWARLSPKISIQGTPGEKANIRIAGNSCPRLGSAGLLLLTLLAGVPREPHGALQPLCPYGPRKHGRVASR